ncbi:MAG: TrkH family potassium uptake protein [Alphaproteobacteria bacterium]
MFDFRPILFVVGLLLSTLAVAMVLPAIVDAAAGHADWQVFLAAAGATLFVGVALVLTTRGANLAIDVRQAFVLTTAAWVSTCAFGALPFAFAGLDLTYAEAFFEATSGVTTTGSTVIVGLDRAPPGILLWRALLQWLGGIGLIVMAVALLPMLHVGGMQLFRTEGRDTAEKILPRAAQIAVGTGLVYLSLTFACTFCYWLGGMNGFDAITHAMTTVSTGGYSTSDSSLGKFSTPFIDFVAVVFMIAGALPFVLWLQAARGRPTALWRDRQVQTFAGVLAAFVVVITVLLWFNSDRTLLNALRVSTVNLVSIVTTTGYATEDYSLWGAFAVTIFFVATFLGGCSGATTGGLKIFRIQVLYAASSAQLKRLLRPHGVFIPTFNRRPIGDDVATSVLSFFFLYMLSFAAIAIALAALDIDMVTAVTASATAIGNVGPGLGAIVGPAGTFAPLPDAAKWILSAGMLLGRLELFTVLVLLAPSFWRR